MAKHLSALNHIQIFAQVYMFVCPSHIEMLILVHTHVQSLIVMMASSTGAVSLLEGRVAGQLGLERMGWMHKQLSSDYST